MNDTYNLGGVVIDFCRKVGLVASVVSKKPPTIPEKEHTIGTSQFRNDPANPSFQLLSFCSRLFSKKFPTGPTERTPKPEYLIALATYLGVR